MTLLPAWHVLSDIGDGAVLLPCAAVLFACLVANPATRRVGWWWLIAVVLMSGGVALTKTLYMVSGWRPAGWNFIGLSGHAASSFLFWPSAGVLMTPRDRPGLRAVMLVLGSCLALAISASSWVLHDHSLVEVVLGALWGASISAVFLAFAWRHGADTPVVRQWMVAGVVLWVIIAFGHTFPSTPVMRWIAMHASGSATIHTRRDLGPQAQLSNPAADCAHAASSHLHTDSPL